MTRVLEESVLRRTRGIVRQGVHYTGDLGGPSHAAAEARGGGDASLGGSELPVASGATPRAQCTPSLGLVCSTERLSSKELHATQGRDEFLGGAFPGMLFLLASLSGNTPPALLSDVRSVLGRWEGPRPAGVGCARASDPGPAVRAHSPQSTHAIPDRQPLGKQRVCQPRGPMPPSWGNPHFQDPRSSDIERNQMLFSHSIQPCAGIGGGWGTVNS